MAASSSSSSSVVELPRIKEVRAFVGKANNAAAKDSGDYHDVTDTHWINGHPTPIANPMSHHPQYAASRKSWGINALGSVVVEIEAEDGTTGYGCSIGGEPAAYIIEKHLSRFVEGQRPSAVELIHDQMMRATLNCGRKGVVIQAISAVDIAIYDLLGKMRKAPVMELLGGPVRDALPIYVTTNRPDVVRANKFCGAKIPLPYGPSAGDEGLRKNVEFFAGWREAVGEHFPLAVDMYMSCTAAYTIKLAKALAPYNPKWLEEFCAPDDYAGYKRVRDAVPGDQLLSSGEHEYTLQGFELLMQTGIDIIQPDVCWCGGVTTYRKVVALAEARGKMVIPHGSSVWSYHVQMASCATPIGEFINLHHDGTQLQSFLSGLVTDEPLPINGHITAEQLRQRPGFGVTFNMSNLVRPYARSEEEVNAQRNKNKVAPPPLAPVAKMPF